MSIRSVVSSWFERLGADPDTATSRTQYLVSYAAALARHCVAQLRDDRAGQMAAALAFRTIFGLVPLSVIGLIAFRLVGGIDRFTSFLHGVLEAAEMDELAIPMPAQDGGEAESVQLIDWLIDLIQQINNQINFESIGLVGLALLAWAAISLMTTVERSFNYICRAPEHRSLVRRVPLYFFTLIMGPGLIYLSFWLDARFDEMVVALAQRIGIFSSTLLWLVGNLTTLGSTWLFFLLLYLYVPNTRLRIPAVASGALVSALLLGVGARAMGGYMSTVFGSSSHYAILYGTLGLIPVFLLWIYIMWLMILFGLEVAVTVQAVGISLRNVKKKKPPLSPVLDPNCIIPIMVEINRLFDSGQSADPAAVASAAHMNEAAVDLFMQRLAQKGLLHRLDCGEDETGTKYALAKSADRIPLDELVTMAHDLCGNEFESSPGWSLVEELRQAQRRQIGGKTLAMLRPESPPTSGD